MKIKILFFVVSAGLILASCSDKAAEEKMAQMTKDMAAADSTCMAEKTMMMDSIMSMQKTIMEMTVAAASTSKTTTTTVKTTTPEVKKAEIGTKSTDGKKVDIKKKGGATGGN